ncbi:CHAT domain-containing protein [Angustibacter sp. McL0619]|uniref:CHAT domain-containing protein n=1 Tax=Angustibacter sp. McL0619 TaxID=3415676 RepID=UPI003CFA779E
MAKHVDFHVILRWAGNGRFDVTILFNAPDDIEDYQYFSSEPISIDLGRLNDLKQDMRAYGTELGRMVFGQSAISYLDRALRNAQSLPVHTRLVVTDDAPLDYQTIRWEALRHPESGARLTTTDNIRFSRYLSNPDGRSPASLSLQDQLSALVVVANPAGIEGYHDGLSRLTSIDVEAEIDRARTALAGMSVRVLAGDEGRASADNIITALRERRTDVLFLVAHGTFDEQGPVLFLENERGNVAKIDGTDLADRIADLQASVPTLAALISCQSAGRADTAATPAQAAEAEDIVLARDASAASLCAFGPALSLAGCAVVVAMQGNISMETSARFVPKFFRELKKDGIAARAMAEARSDISDSDDWYVPVLYSRLKRGSPWYVPRFGNQRDERLRNLHMRIAEAHATPVVGSGVGAEDGILPTRQRMARDWAERRQAPILDPAKSDLASVAQYIVVETDDPAMTRDELAQYMRSYLKTEHGPRLPDRDFSKGDLDEHIRAVGRLVREASGGKDNHSRLAALELPVFVTSAWNSLLEDALRAAGKEPVTLHFEWYRSVPSQMPAPDEFGVERPLVYHLFGTLDERKSIVLTEDDYFAWLRAWMKQVDKSDGIPSYIKPPLTEHALMFLGYGFDDWEFRMIFEAVKGFEGRSFESYSRHVGVQLESGALPIEPEAVQEYLESYLGGDQLDIFWGSCGEFLEDLEDTRPTS